MSIILHSSITYLCEQDAVEELVGLLLVLGDVSISIHTKHLRMWNNGQGTYILHIVLMLCK